MHTCQCGAKRSKLCFLLTNSRLPHCQNIHFTDTGDHSSKIPKMFPDFVLCSPPALTVLLTQAINPISPHPSHLSCHFSLPHTPLSFTLSQPHPSFFSFTHSFYLSSLFCFVLFALLFLCLFLRVVTVQVHHTLNLTGFQNIPKSFGRHPKLL